MPASATLRRWTWIVAAAWFAGVVIASVQDMSRPENNFLIFRTAALHLLAGAPLYLPSPEHRDFFLYSPAFAALFLPIALLPVSAGVLAWNAVNGFALFWSIGRALPFYEATVVRAIISVEAFGSLQQAQSNALVAGLMILAFADVERRRTTCAAIEVGIGSAIKIFPILAATFALFSPAQLRRFAVSGVLAGIVLVALPFLFGHAGQVVSDYRAWLALASPVQRGYSVMAMVGAWTGSLMPAWPVQLLALAVLLSPLLRRIHAVLEARTLYLGSVLMFALLFNHAAESPSFILGVVGAAVWFVSAPRATSLRWGMLAALIIGTILPSSEAMPRVLQERVFEPYRLKTLPVLAIWVLTQWELWTLRSTPTSRNVPSTHASGSAPGPQAS